MTFSLEHPEYLLLLVPLLIGGFYFLKNTRTKLVEWRMFIALLLIIALASPFTVVTKTVSEENPNLVIVSDETDSMEIFEEGGGQGLYEGLVDNTPTSFVRLEGDKTSLGETVLQYAGTGQQIVLVSDGNNNHGKNLVEAIEFAKETGTTVYSVEPNLVKNDLAVEVRGDKTLVVDNENNFEIGVSQAGTDSVKFSLEVYLDEELNLRRSYSLAAGEREKTITYRPDPFSTLGAHNIRVEITPSGEDWNPENNKYYKALYVVPKPKLWLITDEPDSPLAEILSELYAVTIENKFPGIEKIKDSKVLVLDNQFIDSLTEAQVKDIKKYVSEGNGLIVVGGEKAYDLGNYLNSSFETFLPVVSKPSEFKGGRHMMILLDVSPSTEHHQTLGDILGNAIFLLRNENLKDANVGVVGFGSTGKDISGGFVYLGLPYNLKVLEEKIFQLTPDIIDGADRTSLDQGLKTAKEMLEEEEGELDVIIISDGGIEQSYEASLPVVKDLQKIGAEIFFIHIRSSAPSQVDERKRTLYAETFMQELGLEDNYFHIDKGERANIRFDRIEKPSEEEEEEPLELDSYPLLEYSPDHFITRNINITGNILGYNDVTPKAGAERLLITVTGKPVLTTWRYGLGRVAAFSTDNGKGEGARWSSRLYSEENANLISSMANWAIGNPQAEEGAVLEAPDSWLGTPAKLSLIIYDDTKPKLKLDGKTALELSLIGKNVYESSVSPDTIGIHNVSGYPLAINYPLEFKEVGLNENLPPLVRATGGNIYKGENEARAQLLKDARQNAERDIEEPRSLKPYIVLLALLLFLGEVMLRRIREIKRLKKAQTAQEAEKKTSEAEEEAESK